MPERFETREDDKPDLRSEDECHRDAVNDWMRWRGYIGQLRSDQQFALFEVVRGRAEPVVEAELTRGGGGRSVDALRALRWLSIQGGNGCSQPKAAVAQSI